MAAKKKDSPGASAARRAGLEAVRQQQARAERRRSLLFWTAGFTIWRDKKNTPSLAAVQSFTYEGGAHTDQSVTYAQNPPVGGEHANAWLNCGVYDQPVPNESAVHSLEHGAVWVTYDPALAAADVATLRAAIPSTYMVLSPMSGLPAPVVASAWGKQIELTGASDPRLDEFIKAYLIQAAG